MTTEHPRVKTWQPQAGTDSSVTGAPLDARITSRVGSTILATSVRSTDPFEHHPCCGPPDPVTWLGNGRERHR